VLRFLAYVYSFKIPRYAVHSPLEPVLAQLIEKMSDNSNHRIREHAHRGLLHVCAPSVCVGCAFVAQSVLKPLPPKYRYWGLHSKQVI
jgi:hypothetical protein